MRRSPSSVAIALAVGLVLTGCRGEVPTPTADSSRDQAAESLAIEDPPAQPADRDRAPTADPPQLIISVDELQPRLEEDGLRIIDTRPSGEYSAGHIPGAVRVDLDDWKSLSLSDNGLANAHAWSLRVGQLGVSAETPVVVYGKSPTNAARIWWLLRYVGVRDVRMLDGGWNLWQSAGVPVSTEAETPEPAEFIVDFQTDQLADQSQVAELVSTPDAAHLLDTRSAGEFAGTSGPGERKGRIPEFQHLEWNEFLADDGRFKSPEEIEAILEAREVSGDGPSIVHCQSGGRASFAVLALELAGRPVKNYYCGWSEWGADEDAQVESDE